LTAVKMETYEVVEMAGLSEASMVELTVFVLVAKRAVQLVDDMAV